MIFQETNKRHTHGYMIMQQQEMFQLKAKTNKNKQANKQKEINEDIVNEIEM